MAVQVLPCQNIFIAPLLWLLPSALSPFLVRLRCVSHHCRPFIRLLPTCTSKESPVTLARTAFFAFLGSFHRQSYAKPFDGSEWIPRRCLPIFEDRRASRLVLRESPQKPTDSRSYTGNFEKSLTPAGESAGRNNGFKFPSAARLSVGCSESWTFN